MLDPKHLLFQLWRTKPMLKSIISNQNWLEEKECKTVIKQTFNAVSGRSRVVRQQRIAHDKSCPRRKIHTVTARTIHILTCTTTIQSVGR